MLRGLRSIIPAAGEATRLRPHTLVKQKPLEFPQIFTALLISPIPNLKNAKI